ncbi:MAG: DUF3109 family protein [Reichenbachiella sp.]
MIIVDKAVLSDDLKEKHFVCDLQKCKGACCVEGDLGAPLEQDELPIIDGILERVMPYLSQEGREAIEDEGAYMVDDEGEFCTTTIGGKECAFGIYDKAGILKCGIEEAYNQGDIEWQKPISCHLYPIRVTKYDHYDALNYDRWEICDPACQLGDELKVPVYKFLKGPLTRKYGEKWYQDLEKQINDNDDMSADS